MKNKASSLKIILYFIRPYKLQFLALFLIGVLMALFEIFNIALLYPLLSYSTVQSVQSDNLIFNLINKLIIFINLDDPLLANAVLFIFISILNFIFGVLYLLVSLRVTSKITTETKQKIFNKIAHSDYQFFVDNKQGDILYKTSRAPGFIAEVFNNLTKFSIEIILSISTIILLISLSFNATILLMAVGILYYNFTKYLGKKVSYNTGIGRYQLGQKENVILNEYINGIKQIKVYESSYWKTQFDKTVSQFWELWKKDSFWVSIPPLTLYLTIFISIGITLIFIRTYYTADFVSLIPLFGTFALAILRILPRLSNFGSFRMGIMSALPNLENVYHVLEDDTYSKIINNNKKFSHLESIIQFHNVKFSHKNRCVTLNGVSLNIEKGKITAIVGASGSGKSTIIDLFLRLYDVDEGAITIDNINIKEYDISSVLEKIGFVGQETFIYNASIKDNITFGNNYEFSEVQDAAKVANANIFIEKYPQKYDTIVGDRGIKLSGGEKQRIAIARAIVRKPEILILDEATTSLDNISEKNVQEAINNVSKKCTTLIIAHRLSTIQNANIIYLLDNSNIVESGTHEQLINQKGKYWELYNIQIKN